MPNPVQAIVIVGLATVWIWVLGRPVLQSLFDRARRDPVGHFNREMSVLGSTPGVGRGGSPSFAARSGASSMGRHNAQRRRLQIFLGLGIAVVVSLVFALAFRGAFVAQNLIIDVLFVAYTVMAARVGGVQREQGAKVTLLKVDHVPNPVYARTAEGR